LCAHILLAFDLINQPIRNQTAPTRFVVNQRRGIRKSTCS